MKLEPFLLDRWLNQYPRAAIDFDLASSTGPRWKTREVLTFLDAAEKEKLLDTELVYSHPAGSEALRQAIGEMQGVSPETVQIVTGASEALHILFFLAARPGANVIVPAPSFPSTLALPRSFGIEVRTYRLRRENKFRVDPDEIKALADANTQLVVVNTPHNPTGTVLSDDELESLHDFAAGRSIPFVVDEVYHPLYHGRKTRSAARLPHATVLGDFSKAFCLSGLRTGWIIEQDRHRREQYFDTRAYFTVSNTPLGEALATAAVRNRETIFGRARQVTAESLKLLDGFFAAHSELFGWVRPAGGTTTFPWLKSGEDSRAFCRHMAVHRILLAPGDCFGMPEHFRIGFGASGELFPHAIERLDEVLSMEQLAYPHPWTRGNFLDSIKSGYQAQMLVAGNELLGYFVAMKGVDEVHLLNLTVAPAYQRQGWARVMLDALATWARGQHAQWLWLEVRQSNARAVAIYETHGFRRVGVRKNYYPADNSQREDAVVMSLRL